VSRRDDPYRQTVVRHIENLKMEINIRKYNPSKDFDGLMEIIKSEGEEWKRYFDPNYQVVLERSITYVAYIDMKICGYSRSINDFGLYVWVIDLLVDKKYRGNTIGKQLMECIINDFPNQDVFVMSDIDEYYVKLGYKKVGSIFKVE
jgi:GNAT superfamily N-acetyltransferase